MIEMNILREKWKPVFSFLLFLPFTVFAQTKHTKPAPVKPVQQSEPVNPYADIDKKALLIPDSLTRSTEGIASYINANFHLNNEKIRAAFIWVAGNIRYDVVNMYAVNFYEKKEDKIAKPLITRQGICENYAALFTDICEKAGIPCFVIEGYVKLNGQVSDLSHAWCIARTDTAWCLFDPTWAAGYVNNGKFTTKINNDYYAPAPPVFIQTHMPFDYLWQLLYHPVSFTEFNEGNPKENAGRSYFNYPDSIAVFEKQTESVNEGASYYRIEKNGAKNAQVFNWMQNIRQRIEGGKVSQYNAAVADYNDAISHFNGFIRYRNKQFIPMQPDAEIQAMLDSATAPFKRAVLQLNQIQNPGPNIVSLMDPLRRQMNDFAAQAQEQEDWLAKYFSKGKSGRKGMFTKVTWFGIPLN